MEKKRKPANEKFIAYLKDYDKQNARYMRFKFNKKTDADVIAWLEKQPSMQGAIKYLVREAIKAGK